MRKKQLIAFLLVAIMVVTVIPAAAMAAKEIHPAPIAQQTPVVTATRTPRLTASSTPPWPVRDQRYVVGGSLREWVSDVVIAVPNRPIQIWWKYPSETNYHYWCTVRTSSTGYYYFTDHEGGQRAADYKIVFAGDSVYHPITKYFRVCNGYTTTTIYANPSNPTPSRTFNIYGYVKSGYNTGITGVYSEPVKIYYKYYTASTKTWSSWSLKGTVNPGVRGYYHKSFSDTKLCQFYAVFQGYPYNSASMGSKLYWSSTSRILQVDAR